MKRTVLAFVMGGLVASAAGMAAEKVGAVIPREAAEHRKAPSGKADVWLLARGDNAFLGRLTMEAGARVPEHADPTEEYIHVLEGRGRITIDGVHHEVKPGTTIYMPAGAKVSYENGDSAFVGIQVFAGPGPADKYDQWTPVGR